ncbi:MAG TPA: cytidylate kinase family protein [archaeon]|jgi:cytidylate kinase|nr:cytidylate kinase family protein [archaeon]
MIVLICGFSASGKSYLVNSVAKKLKYKHIHTSDILNQFASGIPENKIQIENTKMNNGWYEFSGLDKKRDKSKFLDKKLDKFLIKLVNTKDNLVLDSWTLPYLVKKNPKIIKIWLDATEIERAKRLSLRDKISFKEAHTVLKEKDSFSKTHFQKLYGFTLGKDKKVFDLVINTNKLSIKQVEEKTMSFLKKKIKIK